jgi:hypothetical protein
MRGVKTKIHARYIRQELKNMKNKFTQQNASLQNAAKLNKENERINFV